ncbi:helix-turn-helix domain-containing protein [Streptomyces sp. NPDC057411]|uniref:helix-turn-helix domain-containing protein n=1 Tax=unclassified Streptomyces TaxID=2593676 RepID=UPI003641C5B8
MGRPPNPIANTNNATGRLAERLRNGMALRNLTYRQLSESTVYHPSTLQRAADGKTVSSWPVVEKFALACDLDLKEVKALWKAASAERRVRRVPRVKPVGVEQIHSYTELGIYLADLRERKGSPSYRLMERRALAHWKWFGRLPHSTAQRLGTRQISRPTLNQTRAFLLGCNIPAEDHGDLVRAWHRADATYKQDQTRQTGGPRPEHAADEYRQTREREILKTVQAMKTVQALGYVPMEAFRGQQQPWSVICRSCGRNRRIRLDWETKRQQQPGVKPMRCKACEDAPTAHSAFVDDCFPHEVEVSGRGLAR